MLLEIGTANFAQGLPWPPKLSDPTDIIEGIRAKG
jgi:hypothetical protein